MTDIRYMAIDADGFSMGQFKTVAEIPTDAHKVRRVFRTNYGTWTINTADGYYRVFNSTLVKL